MDLLLLKGFKDGSWRRQTGINSSIYAALICIQSSIADADDPMSLFTSILKDIAEETIPKTSAVPKRFNKTGPLRGLNVNQPRVTWMPIALLGLRLTEISDTVRKHLGEIMFPRWILKHRLNLCGIGSVKSRERIQVTLFTIYLTMIEMSRLIVTILMYWQITFLIIPPLLSGQMPLHMFARKLKSRL